MKNMKLIKRGNKLWERPDMNDYITKFDIRDIKEKVFHLISYI